MARIHIDDIDDIDDSLPDLAGLVLVSPRKTIQPQLQPRWRSRQALSWRQSDGEDSQSVDESRSRRVGKPRSPRSQRLDVSDDNKPGPRRKEKEDGKAKKPRQRVLKKVEGNARLGLGFSLAGKEKEKEKGGLVVGEEDGDERTFPSRNVESKTLPSRIVESKTLPSRIVESKTLPSRTPRRVLKSRVQRVILSDDEDAENDGDGLDGVEKKEEYDSDDSLPSPSRLFRKPRLFGAELDKTARSAKEPSLKLGKFLIPSLPSSAVASKESLVSKIQPILPTTSRPTSSSDNDKSAFLIYTPPKRCSPAKRAPQSARPSTPPPSSPKQNILNSPTKSRPAKIPTAPLQPDIDAFWSQDVVNDWNEQWSPKKVLASPKKNRFITPDSDNDSDAPSPSTSPRKSPTKKDKSAIQAKKDFESRKHQLAEDFLQELDSKVTNGQIGELAASSGGVQIIWNKKLNSTAGRANWRRECIKTTHTNGTISRKYRHIANIELSEKVIDDTDRLINVLAHEFCHLANFMVSGVKDNPHGKEFKEWAKKCSSHFGERNVIVTTKHSYDISYKFCWECTGCGVEYQRHSRSIDPRKHSCGTCKAPLVQVRPVPRAVGGKGSEYQTFVKENFGRVKKEMRGVSHGAVMEVLGREYREGKGGGVGATATAKGSEKKELDIESVMRELEVITLDD